MLKQLEKRNKRIIFVRHAESIGNARGLDDNSLSDIPNHQFGLTENGRKQGRQAGLILKTLELNWQQAFISGFQRTRETWNGINTAYPYCLAPPICDQRLNEWWRGIWHAMSKEDIARLYPLEEKIQQREGWYHYRALGGQSGPDVELQIHSFLADFLYGRYSDWQTILIVGHGKWGILFWRIMTGATVAAAEEKMRTNFFGNCSITMFDGCGVNEVSTHVNFRLRQ